MWRVPMIADMVEVTGSEVRFNPYCAMNVTKEYFVAIYRNGVLETVESIPSTGTVRFSSSATDDVDVLFGKFKDLFPLIHPLHGVDRHTTVLITSKTGPAAVSGERFVSAEAVCETTTKPCKVFHRYEWYAEFGNAPVVSLWKVNTGFLPVPELEWLTNMHGDLYVQVGNEQGQWWVDRSGSRFIWSRAFDIKGGWQGFYHWQSGAVCSETITEETTVTFRLANFAGNVTEIEHTLQAGQQFPEPEFTYSKQTNELTVSNIPSDCYAYVRFNDELTVEKIMTQTKTYALPDTVGEWSISIRPVVEGVDGRNVLAPQIAYWSTPTPAWKDRLVSVAYEVAQTAVNVLITTADLNNMRFFTSPDTKFVVTIQDDYYGARTLDKTALETWDSDRQMFVFALPSALNELRRPGKITVVFQQGGVEVDRREIPAQWSRFNPSIDGVVFG